MPEWGALLIVLAGLFILAHLFNYFTQSAYWWWADWRASKEDEKMLKEQEETAEKMLDNIVKLDDRRKVTFIVPNYDDDTIH
jgi:uncharacterized protein involved in tolerance to divalent cations